MGFKVIDIAYGIDAYEAVVKVATLDAKIPLFLFDFNIIKNHSLDFASSC